MLWYLIPALLFVSVVAQIYQGYAITPYVDHDGKMPWYVRYAKWYEWAELARHKRLRTRSGESLVWWKIAATLWAIQVSLIVAIIICIFW